jgi:hypothetical protein
MFARLLLVFALGTGLVAPVSVQAAASDPLDEAEEVLKSAGPATRTISKAELLDTTSELARWLANTTWGGEHALYSVKHNEWRSFNSGEAIFLITFEADGRCFILRGNSDSARPIRTIAKWNESAKGIEVEGITEERRREKRKVPFRLSKESTEVSSETWRRDASGAHPLFRSEYGGERVTLRRGYGLSVSPVERLGYSWRLTPPGMRTDYNSAK